MVSMSGPPQAGVECLGDFGVFDDVGPVFEDPASAVALALDDFGERLGGVVEESWLAAAEAFDEVVLVARGGVEDGVEDGVEFGAAGDEFTV